MSPELLKGSLALLGFGAVFLFYASLRMKDVQRVHDTPRSRLESAPQGFVEVQGFAWPVDQASVVSGREVLFHSVVIEEHQTEWDFDEKRSKKKWVPVFNHLVSHPFYLVDATGLAEVDLGRSDFSMERASPRPWSSLPRTERERLLQLVGDQRPPGFPPWNFLGGLFGHAFRATESKLYVGSPMYACGNFHTPSRTKKSVQVRGLADFHRNVFNAQARSERNVDERLDKNKDGKVSEEEAREGYAFIANLARRKPEPSGAAAFPIHGSLGSSAEHRLLIANVHEKYMDKRLRRKVYAPLTAGAAFVAAALYLLVFVRP